MTSHSQECLSRPPETENDNLSVYLMNISKQCKYLHFKQEVCIYSFPIILYMLSSLGRVSGPLRIWFAIKGLYPKPIWGPRGVF